MTVVQQETVHQVSPRMLVQVLAIESQAVRMPQSCWPVTCDKGPLSQAVRMPQSCWPGTCDKGPSALDCETCCGSSWTSRSQTLNGPRKVSKHRITPGITNVEKPRRRHEKQNKAASTGTTEDQPGGDTGLGHFVHLGP